ncbi:high nitrogen upregulated cytochrome P450 monooxygenase 2 [Gloeopeniophorella convolvens]|nr:high nitrogen upregulated cytochrome P450 monooxygenase 2 [Gloeopeniophorella convolvens]
MRMSAERQWWVSGGVTTRQRSMPILHSHKVCSSEARIPRAPDPPSHHTIIMSTPSRSLLFNMRDRAERLDSFGAFALAAQCSFVAYLYFKRFEPQTRSQLIPLLLLVPGCLSYPFSHALSSTFRGTATAFVSYYGLIILYTIVYRLSPWHPLAKHPGPVLARVSKLWSAMISAQGKQHIYYKNLHEQYGDVVRTGPNELSIRDASIIPSVLGPGGLAKGPIWDNRREPDALIAIRDPTLHARARKPWDRGLSSRALKDYEPRIAKRANQLVERLEDIIRREGKRTGAKKPSAVVDMNAWLGYFATDFMGDMAFGGGFELMANGGDNEKIWTTLSIGLAVGATASHVNWILPVLRRLSGNLKPLFEFGQSQVTRRLNMGANRKDLFYYLSGEDQTEADRPPLSKVMQQGLLAIIAGSDTTSTTMTAVIYYLIRHPAVYERLLKEIDEAFPTGEEPLDATRLSGLQWLNACITESLRLQPAVPSGSQRSVSHERGPRIFGTHVIPEQTQIAIHTYSVHRDPRNFYSPDAFKPERWLAGDSPDGAHNPTAFFPFSLGPTACVGKNLALMEMRMVVCLLLRRFRFSAAPGMPLEDWEDSVKDLFVMYRGPFTIEISLREDNRA